MRPDKFEEGQVWAHRYGGTPEMNAHYLVKRIDGKLYLESAYHRFSEDDIDINGENIYYCGEYDGDYFPLIFKKELEQKNG